jgi:putative hydrolase of the HAD superfamily
LQQFQEILSPFHAVVLSHDIGVRKPHAGFFGHCRRLADCAADECLFIDDLPANVAGAQAAGLQGVVYAPGADFEDRLRELGITI